MGNEDGPTRWYVSNPTALDQLQSIGRRIDSGIEQISIDNFLGDPQLKLRHSGLDQVIELQLESRGTRQFIKLFPFIQMALERGSVAVADDIDSAIHPLFLLRIIRWFVDEKRIRSVLGFG